jgi:hypothetical protein
MVGQVYKPKYLEGRDGRNMVLGVRQNLSRSYFTNKSCMAVHTCNPSYARGRQKHETLSEK